jgi:hypothetical protein
VCALHQRGIRPTSADRRGPLRRSRPAKDQRSPRRPPPQIEGVLNYVLNLTSYLWILIHAIRACETWAYKLAHRLAGHANATYFHQHQNRRISYKPVISRTFIASYEDFRLVARRDCQHVNRPLPMPCVLRLAASQHRNFRTAPLSPIFISTMTPGQGLNRTTGDYQCCSRSSA